MKRRILFLAVCMSLAPLVASAGCKKDADTTATGGSGPGSAAGAAPKGPPPVPSNLPPEIQARITKEQAEFQARSQQSRQHAKTPPSGDVAKKQ